MSTDLQLQDVRVGLMRHIDSPSENLPNTFVPLPNDALVTTVRSHDDIDFIVEELVP